MTESISQWPSTAIDKENQPSIQRLDDSESGESSKRKNPYRTLPATTSSYIQLRFQLAHIDGVYRSVKVPLNYTFANLHTLIQYLFGWNNSHLHQAHVYTHVEKHSGDRAGHMKRYGCPLTPPDYMVPRGPRYEIDMKFWNLTHSKAAYYEVVPMMRNRSNGRDPRGAGFDFQERVEDHEVTLDMVWDAKKERNSSKGRCENTEIGIIYEYDLGASWEVHITLGHDNDLFTVAPPMNVPIVVEAKGAPPIEDAHCDIPGEIEPYDKTVNFLLYDEETFVKYCNGDVGTCARKTELAVFDKEGERQRVQEI